MTGPRIFIILGVLLVVLFAISLAAKSQTQRSTVSSDPPPWVQSLKQTLLGDAKVAPAEISSSCLVDDRTAFAFTGATAICEAQIGESRKRVRKLTLAPVAPATFNVHYQPDKADEEAIPVTIRRLTSEKPAELVILKHGGMLTVTSLSPTKTARLNIK
jgi:hypothetical protein